MLCGTYDVFEDREGRGRQKIRLNIAVLPAASDTPRPDPIFYLAGGPGGAATARATAFASSWMREDRDLVMIDQRGSGASHPLRCRLRGGPDDVQGYTLTAFDQLDQLEACRNELGTSADLGLYGTPAAVDDIDEVREALGYHQINLLGLSWGSRTALVYMRRHPTHLRRVIANGIVPLSLTYPLFHARDSQRSLDLLLEECAHDEACSTAFPDLGSEFQAVLDRLEAAPATVTVSHPDTGQPVAIELTRAAFTEWVRWFLSSLWGTRWFPIYVNQAFVGNLEPVAQDLVETTQFYNQRLAIGQLMSVVCPEDVARIEPSDIPSTTAGTFMGAARVYQVLDACGLWPPGDIAPDYGDPVSSDVPTLLWSGTLDPRCPPSWGDDAAQHLERSLHLVVPGAHGVTGPCIDAVSREFLDSATPLDVDTSCVESIVLPPFEVAP
jgi:pimeloyl-ACP methyl ester carboxylesterase